MFESLFSYVLVALLLGLFSTGAVKMVVEHFSTHKVDPLFFLFGTLVLSIVYLYLIWNTKKNAFVRLLVLKILVSATFLIIGLFFTYSLYVKVYNLSGSNTIVIMFILALIGVYVLYVFRNKIF